MPETNGHQDNPSRLDRMESMIEHIVNDHIVLEDKLGRLTERVDKLTINVDKLALNVAKLHDTASLQASTLDRVITKLAETDDKLYALISVVETDHREFHERLNRLESVQ